MNTPATITPDTLAAFGLAAERTPIELGDGHIHRTWTIPDGPILQRINTDVFPDPDALAENLGRISQHLDRRAAHPVPRLIPTADGEPAWQAPDGSLWRALQRLPGATRPAAETPAIVFNAAEAFGRFVANLADLPPPPLRVTIHHFHDLPRRWAHLCGTADRDPAGRAAAVHDEIDHLARMVERFGPQATPLPPRTVHNDAKLSNLLWEGDAVSAVIDLDTVMPGRLRDDFGDLLRTFATTAPEDERDLARVEIVPARLEAVVAGFLAGLGDLPTAAERADMSARAAEITTEQAVRFLDDHLAGDRYYRVATPDQNLVRARNQIRLAERLVERQAGIEALLT